MTKFLKELTKLTREEINKLIEENHKPIKMFKPYRILDTCKLKITTDKTIA